MEDALRRTATRDPEVHADGILLLDGPYEPEQVAAAAELAAELIRRLNHATLWTNASVALPYPSHVDRQVAVIHTLLSRLPQLLQQLGHRLGSFESDPHLCTQHVPRRPSGSSPDAHEVVALANDYLSQVGTLLGEAQARLNEAHNLTARLYLHAPAEE